MKRLESKYAPLHLVPLIERLGTPQVISLICVRCNSRNFWALEILSFHTCQNFTHVSELQPAHPACSHNRVVCFFFFRPMGLVKQLKLRNIKYLGWGWNWHILGKLLVCMYIAMWCAPSLGRPSANSTKSNQFSCARVYIYTHMYITVYFSLSQIIRNSWKHDMSCAFLETQWPKRTFLNCLCSFSIFCQREGYINSLLNVAVYKWLGCE